MHLEVRIQAPRSLASLGARLGLPRTAQRPHQAHSMRAVANLAMLPPHRRTASISSKEWRMRTTSELSIMGTLELKLGPLGSQVRLFRVNPEWE
jgi:hypothetical protein